MLSHLSKETVFEYLLGVEDYDTPPAGGAPELAGLSPGDPDFLRKTTMYAEQQQNKLLSLLSKEDTFQWAEMVRNEDQPSTLFRIVAFASIKYKEYEEVYTDEEKNRLVLLIVHGVEKDIKNRGDGYGALGNIHQVDHPLVDELIDRLKPLTATDGNCRFWVNSLMKGLAATRTEKAMRMKAAAGGAAGHPNPAPSGTGQPAQTAAGLTEQVSATASSVLWPWFCAAGAGVIGAVLLLARGIRRHGR